MKRIISIIVFLLLLSSSFAVAETNLSEMSYDDLIALQKDLVFEIMSRPEWKEVEVPAGQYTIGVDIPAGWYSMKPKNSYGQVFISWEDENGIPQFIMAEDVARYELKKGIKIEVNNITIFAPPRSLNF